MSHKFQSSIQHRSDVSYVKLGGVIDEDNELADLVDKIPQGTAVIDLGEIERINSCGVRDWVNWLAKLENNGTRSVLVECSPAIVAQINLVNNFTGNGVVKSFYVPYFCPECDEEKVLLVEASDMGPPPHEPPTCRCDECDLVMDFDDMPDSYFAFLSNQRRLAEPEKINGAMRDFGRGTEPEAARNKVRSRASQPNLSQGSKPSVPSLPSMQRGTAPGSAPGMTPGGPINGRPYTPTPPRPQLGAKPPTGPGRPPMMTGPGMMPNGAPMHPSQPPGAHFAAPGMHPGHMPGPAPGPMQGQLPGQMGHMPHMQGQAVAGHMPGHHSGPIPGMAPMQGHMPNVPPSSGPLLAHPNHPSHPGMHPSAPNLAGNYGYGASSATTAIAPPKSNAIVFVLIAILVAAIGVLAYLVATK